jgi:hypothetical protein
MGLLDKVRILVGALVHKPFMPAPERVDLDERPEPPQESRVHQDGAALEPAEAGIEDTDRVADLLTQQRREDGT